MKRMVVLLPLFLFLFTGCLPTVELNERAIVQAIGIDEGEDGSLLLTLQIFDPGGGGDSGGMPSFQDNYIVKSEGATVTDAMKNSKYRLGKKVFHGQNRLVVVGSRIAKHRLSEVLDFFNANFESNANVTLVVSRGDAGDILKTVTNQSEFPAQDIQSLIANGKESGRILTVTVFDTLRTFSNQQGNAYIPMVDLQEKDEEQLIIIEGLAVIKQKKYIGELDIDQTRGCLWINDEIIRTYITAQVPDVGLVSVEVSDVDSIIKPEIDENGKVHFHISVDFNTRISEVDSPQGRQYTIDQLPDMEERLEKVVEGEIQSALHQTIGVLHTDLYQLRNRLENRYPKEWREMKDHWGEEIRDIEFSVAVHCNMDRLGLESKNEAQR